MVARTCAIVAAFLFLVPSNAVLEEAEMSEAEHLGVMMLQKDQTLMVDHTEKTVNATAASPKQAAEAEAPEASAAPEAASLAQEQAQTAASSLKFSAIVAEFIAMTLFVVIGCGSAMGIAKEEGSAWILQVSLTFGLAITALAYTIGHYSGGHINGAVTLGLVIAGKCSIVQGILNFVAQMLGSIFGAFLLTMIYPAEKDRTGGLGSNAVGDGWSTTNALLGEILMTFLLMFVVLETTSTAAAANSSLAPLAIGLAVFLAHSVLIPIDGCSINPTRSFGPWLMNSMRSEKPQASQWIFWVGPLVGAAIGAGIHIAISA